MSRVAGPVGTAAAALWYKHRPEAVGAAKNTIAVLPLQNMNGDVSVEFLRFALADEISQCAHLHSHPRCSSLVGHAKVRGERRRSRKGGARAARCHRSDRTLPQTGRQSDGHAGGDRCATTTALLWQTNLTAPAQDLIALQNQMTAQVRQRLASGLGAAGGAIEAGTRPKDPEAYDLYLHSLALPHDPAANKDAIAVLEHVVQADPNYAPAWEQLGLRYYYDSTYSDGGEAMFQRSNEAYEHALDAGSQSHCRRRTAHHQPRRARRAGQGLRGRAGAGQEPSGKRPGALRDGLRLSLRRNAGAIHERMRHRAGARSGQLHVPFLRVGFHGTREDGAGRGFHSPGRRLGMGAYVTPSLLLREGKIAEAKEAVKQMPTAPRYHRDLLEACLGLRPAAELDRLAHEAETSSPAAPDAELWYYQGAIFGYCGKKQAALRLLQSAVNQNYCSYSNLIADPLLEKLRADPAFNKVLKSARECQEAMLASSNSQGK